MSNSDCKLIGKGRGEQNERLLLSTKTMGTLCCGVAAARPVRGTAAEPENAAPSPPYLGALTSLVLTTRCCGNQAASDKATLTKSNMWENGRPGEKLILYVKIDTILVKKLKRVKGSISQR